ncbi:MAG: DUF4145 domain-containing protein [Desulfobacterales bacterium]|nr:DUF4145 domain-containing protein [Desulfobacterales bacterium]
MQIKLMEQLDLDRCPHCGVDRPTISILGNYQTQNFDKSVIRHWATYSCKRCGGAIVASAKQMNYDVTDIFPKSPEVDPSVPPKAQSYLTQAINSKSAPAGAVMLTASAVDAMLKAKSYTEGGVYQRIEAAVNDHLITPEMAQWAHEVRLEDNGREDADEAAALPSAEDAEKVIDFALALADFLFVLPAKIQRGIGN